MTNTSPVEEFTVKYGVGCDRTRPVCILKDNVTGVEYIVIVYVDSHCVIPRLYPDGSLYCGPERSLSDAEKHAQYLSRKQNLEKSKVCKWREADE